MTFEPSYLYVFILQALYWYVKILNTKTIIKNNLGLKNITVILSNLVWLGSLFFSISELMDNNIYIIIPFILGSLVGTTIEHLSYKTKSFDR